jgi:CHAT domain-containing protein
MQDWLAKRDGLLLEYMVGIDGSYLLIVPDDDLPKLIELKLNGWQARELDAEAGSISGDQMVRILANAQKSGIIDRLKKATSPAKAEELAPDLAALWQVLIPEDERNSLVSEKYRRLFVIPDGPLAMLPFETLVTEQLPTGPVYLIDSGPTVQYAPSATILNNLTPQDRRQLSGLNKPVLTVGDPAYPSSGSGGSSGQSVGSRYGKAGGQLSRLPFTGWETTWLDQVFNKAGIGVDTLTRDKATEANIRRMAPGRMLVHLACHGVADQAHGNLFGALALAPGSKDETTDDGFLTLAEIYNLNLNDCELAILSACDTNLGPQQRGEGVWAVSRGFLVAGSRRIVASNWLVDDEAAASLMSIYCSRLARNDTSGNADYAAALHEAKKWVRSRDKWSSPYYWGSFVLIGPH